MRQLIPAWGALALALLFATIAAAQGTGRLDGQVLGFDGKPYPDVTVEIKNPETGQVYTLKTDKDGKFKQFGLRTALYTITLTNEKDHLNYSLQTKATDAEVTAITINLKELAAKGAAENPEEAKKRGEEEAKFKGMKEHFDAAQAAKHDLLEIREQLRKPPPGQKEALQQKLNAHCQTAITDFQQAEQSATPKDLNNHALVWANLGETYEFCGKFEEAADAFQKAIALRPQPAYYVRLGTNLASVAAAETDPKASESKLTEANASCDKAVALDPANGGSCWKNVGIVLTNKGRMKEAIAPLQKVVQSNPKDAQAWFLLGGALAGTIEPKQEGDKMIYIIPSGTAEAYRKCIEVAPNSEYAPQAKAALDQLAAMSGGEETSLSKKKKH
jgi:tetratricopeptide (TPR) repeat protein